MPDESAPPAARPADRNPGAADRGSDARAGRGSDLARDALAAARASSAARRKAAGRTPRTSAGSAGKLRRRRWSGSGPDAARDPQPLGLTMRSWVKAAGTGADLTKATLFGRWEKIVGADVANRCSPTSLVDGELVVQAESTAWATQIRLLAPQLLTKINTELGERAVIRIRAKGPAGPSWRFGERHVRGRGPRDTYG
ncbi:MAG TPA: DciA family protein [Nakamurella sp.]|jgi:predicted nucleic acid-binding Zn ribbon protein